MSQRINKINPLIRQTLAQIIAEEIEFPENSIVAITRVETSPDIKHSKIFISVIPEKFRGTALEILRKNTKNLHHRLKKQIKTKFTPNLQFQIDDQAVYASEIDKLLDEL